MQCKSVHFPQHGALPRWVKSTTRRKWTNDHGQGEILKTGKALVLMLGPHSIRRRQIPAKVHNKKRQSSSYKTLFIVVITYLGYFKFIITNV